MKGAQARTVLGLVALVACGPAPTPAADGGTGSTSTTPSASTGAPDPASTGSPADSGTTAAIGGSTSLGTTGAGSSSGADGPPGIFDLPVPDAPAPPRETPPWLLHLALVAGERHLFQVDIETAVPTDICTVIDAATMQPYTAGTPSLTFTRDDRLLFSSGTALYEIALPSCIATMLGPIGVSGVFGICPDEAFDLYGLSNTDVLLHIDAQTGVGTTVGPLGDDWGMLGGTWNETEQQILGINSLTDGLYEIDALSGMATLAQVLPLDFANVGVEYHPLTGQIYACTSDSHLYRLENDGTLTDLGDMGFSTCTNLGAPWSEDVPLPTPN